MNNKSSLQLFDENGNRLYLYILSEYESSRYLVSTQKMSKEEFTQIIDDMYAEYRKCDAEFNRQNHLLWEKRQAGEITEDEWSDQLDALFDTCYHEGCIPNTTQLLANMGFVDLYFIDSVGVFEPDFDNAQAYEKYLEEKSKQC